LAWCVVWESAAALVYVVPVREDIMPPVTFLMRRAVKEAMEAKADWLILDMETNGGRVDVTEEIIQILNQFKGQTATFINRKAFSAGAFIAVSTQKIYMAPQSVVGAAAPIMMAPGGGAEQMPESTEAKITSAIRALVRTSAEKNGHNYAVVEAMIDRSRELVIDGEVLNEKGQILALTNVQAEKKYGEPAKPLFSLGTVENIQELIQRLGVEEPKVVQVQPTGAERVASFLTEIGPLLLLVGIIGIYIEMKTPGFGLPGMLGLVGFALYFLGGYIAGLSGLEWLVVFVLGLALLLLEIFVFPGTLIVGLAGGALMLVALVMAMVDVYPGSPTLPSFSQVQAPLFDVFLASTAALVIIALLSRFLLKAPLFNRLVASGVSGVESGARTAEAQQGRLGRVGVALSQLRPGGKAEFDGEPLDVMTQGELIQRGTRVRIIGFSGHEAVVEPVPNQSGGSAQG